MLAIKGRPPQAMGDGVCRCVAIGASGTQRENTKDLGIYQDILQPCIPSRFSITGKT